MINLNCDWKFTRNDDRRAWQKRYDDSEWQDITLPHDWSVGEPFDINNSSGTGYLAAGKGWYRKRFFISAEDAGKRVYITFDGVYNNSQVWCNGYYLGKRPYGYSTFTYDITDFACFGDIENVVCVFVNHEHLADSRWFTGSGIYRKVTLTIKDQVSIDNNGLFVSTKESDAEKAVLSVQCAITNHTDKNAEIKVIYSFSNEEKYNGGIYSVSAGETINAECALNVRKPKLWSPDSPDLYKLKAEIEKDGGVTDSETVITGIRTFYFDADKGFFLNGVNLKMKGVCVHHDAGCLGAAAVKKVWERRLEKLKEMGCNAIRMSHNPHMPELYDLCDSMGFLVIDEAFDEWEGVKNKWQCGHNVYPPAQYGYSEDFPAWHEADLTAMVLRDRNHPSVILWSIGNEIDYPNDPYVYPGLKRLVGNNDANKPEYEQVYDPSRPDAKRLAVVAKKLMAIVKKHDCTRPVTAALAFPELSNLSGFADVLDVVGYNYKEQYYKQDHENYSGRVIFGSENGHHLNAWLDVVNNDYISGQFLWTGIDFLGETRGWPCHGSQAGLLDVAGFEKPSYYFRKSLWLDKPVLQLAATYCEEKAKEARPANDFRLGWNFETDKQVKVAAYTNCESVELFLNGESIGVKNSADNKDKYYLTWELPFKKGELSAVGTTVGGEQCTCSLKTYGAPAALKLTAKDPLICADGQDITHIEINVVDCDGELSANACPNIQITVEGEGTLLGIESGNLFDNTPYSSKERRANNGKLLIYIRSTKQAGEIKATASSRGLLNGSVIVKSN